MLDAAVKALAQMLTPPFRRILLRAALLALLLLVVTALALFELLSYLTQMAQAWAAAAYGISAALLSAVALALSIATALGLIGASIFLMPAVSGLIAGLYADEIAALVEARHYPGDPPGQPLPTMMAVYQGARTALWAILVYLLAMPSLLLAGAGVVVFFLAAALLLGREYFELAAMRFHPPAEAAALRRAHRRTVFFGGILIAAFVSIPIVNLATPLFGTAFMVHLHKRLTRGTAAGSRGGDGRPTAPISAAR